ncbi:MAG: 2-C-methyl-D-erythritol 4-phosphate cytidylyltransferase [Thermodesulfobacteria bacterium]|nr:2-C-methyl-D-erythritol 4-phosphate cytidylyltransferase [Thermodesulfobacteriota bacterium]
MLAVVIPSAGKGERLGAKVPKQFLEINGIPILGYTLQRFEKHPEIDAIIVATSLEYQHKVKKIAEKLKIKKLFAVVEGGKTRQQSVFKGILACPKSTKLVLVHDAVRPFVSAKLVSRIINAVKKYKAVVPAIPVRDALQKVSDNKIIHPVDRTGLYHIQTPQAGEYELLKNTLERAEKEGKTFPDESSLLKHYGYEVRIVEGEFINFKITYPEDFVLAESLINCKIEALT